MSPIYVPGKVTLRQTHSTWAEGGDLVYTIVVSGTTYRVHEFKTVGTSSLNVMKGGSVEYLVVAGGGGGGNNGGAGGAGGMKKFVTGEAGNDSGGSLLALSTSVITISIGSGGAGGTGGAGAGYPNGFNGTSSSIGAFISTTGGGGGGGAAAAAGNNGGSGGGGGWGLGARLGGSGIIGEGSNGGDSTGNNPGGGGGGKGGAGGHNSAGPGLASLITGSSITYATGGGAVQGAAGAAFTGNGGGGGGTGGGNGGNGGSGIVIVRYAI
jgi:hypothetical protein